MIIQSLFDILPIILLILLGYVLNENKKISIDFSEDISYIIMNIALPASIISSILNKLNMTRLLGLWKALLIATLAYILNYILAFIFVKLLNIPKGKRGTFINTIVNANTIFIGMPLNISLFGMESMDFFLTYYVLNTISTWSIGATLIENDGIDSSNNKKFNIKSLITTPVISLIIAIILLAFNVKLPSFINTTLTYIGNLLTPLALIFIGIAISKAGIKSIRFDRHTIEALIGKFVLSPLVMACILYIWVAIFGKLELNLSKTFIIQSAVPALTIMPILANEGKGDVPYATNVVVTSTLLFVIVIPIVMNIIS